jgi:hypothetical protein
MTTVQAIEAAVELLAPEQRAEFLAWFEAFDGVTPIRWTGLRASPI